MRIKNLELHNIGRHNHIKFDCNAAVVGVLGPNGAGKSTILESLEILLTGSSPDPQEKPLDSYVKDGHKSGTMHLDFSKGQNGSVTRKLGSGASRSLHWDGRNLTKAAEVETLMATILGADKSAIASAVFINQGHLQQILFGTPGEREDMFVRLVNLSYCDKIAGIIDGKIKKLQVTVTDLTAQKDAATTQALQCNTAWEERKKELAACPSVDNEIDHCQKVKANEAMLTELTTQEAKLAVQLGLATADYDRVCKEFKVKNSATVKAACGAIEATYANLRTKAVQFAKTMSAVKNHAGIEKQIAEVSAKLAEDQALLGQHNLVERQQELRKVKDALAALNAMAVAQANKVAKAALIDGLRKGLAVFQQGCPGYTREDIRVLEVTLQKDTYTLKQLQGWLAYRQKISKCVDVTTLKCPECGLSISDANEVSPQELAKLERQVSDLATKVHRLGTDIHVKSERLRQYNDSLQRMQISLESKEAEMQVLLAECDRLDLLTIGYDGQQLLALEKELNLLLVDLAVAKQNATAGVTKLTTLQASQTSLAGIDVAAYTDGKYIELNTNVDNVRGTLEAKTKLHSQLLSLENNIVTLEHQRSDLVERINQLSTEAEAENIVGLALLGELKTQFQGDVGLMLAELVSQRNQRNQLVGAEAEAERNATQAALELQRICERMEKDRVKLKCIDNLCKLKTVMTELPKQYVRYRFEQLAALTQKHLASINANFSIAINPDKALSFQFTRLDDGATLGQGKLSGGQKVKLCLAFLMAVQEALVPEVGLLVLDEPSTHLDQEGVESLAEFIRDLNHRLSNTDHQIWIVDHHPALEPCFGKVLKLTQ